MPKQVALAHYLQAVPKNPCLFSAVAWTSSLAWGTPPLRASHQDVITIPSRFATFVNAFRPPLKAGGRANKIRAALEGSTAGELRVFEVLNGSGVLVDQGGVGLGPQVLSRL